MNKRAIVCVDDERVILVSLRNQLKRWVDNEYIIELAESGEEALEIFEELIEEGIDMPLVISDHIMPGMKGDDQLLKELHLVYPQTLKVMLTGQASTDAVGNAVNQANLYRYMTKPWDETDLELTVTEALRPYVQERQLVSQSENKKIAPRLKLGLGYGHYRKVTHHQRSANSVRKYDMTLNLTKTDLVFFKENGYLIKRQVLNSDLMGQARERMWAGMPSWYVLRPDILRPWSLLGSSLALFIALVTKRKILSLLLTLSILIIGLAFIPLFLPRFTSPPAGQLMLRVMSFNTWLYSITRQTPKFNRNI